METAVADPPAAGAQVAGSGKASGWALRWRVLSGVVFVPLLVLLARAGGLAFVGFVALQMTLGLIEFYGMMRRKALAPHVPLGIVTGLGGRTMGIPREDGFDITAASEAEARTTTAGESTGAAPCSVVVYASGNCLATAGREQVRVRPVARGVAPRHGVGHSTQIQAASPHHPTT